MPAIDPNANTAAPKTRVRKRPAAASPKVKVKKKAAPAPRVNSPSPDQVDRSRSARAEQLERSVPKTPDQADRKRAPAQQAHDRQVTKTVVRESRRKAIRREHRGSGVRAVKKVAGTAAAIAAAPFQYERQSRRPGSESTGGGGGALIANIRLAGPVGSLTAAAPRAANKYVRNAAADSAEIITGAVPSTIETVKVAVKDPKKLPGMLVDPYKEVLADPKKAMSERPVSTALMFSPAVKMPGRMAGKVARVTGKQTLERPDATLPGTALKKKRTGSRDVVVRAKQSRDDRKDPAPKMTGRDVQQRVDEHYEHAKQHVRRAERQATRAAKGRTPEERRDAAQEAREQAQREMDEQFAREFGANQRLSAGAAPRQAAHTRRTDADAQVKKDRKAAAGAKRQLVRAKKDAKKAYKSASSALEGARAARVRSGPQRGVPPVEHDALLRALMDRDDSTAALARARTAVPAANAQLKSSRGAADTARTEHIAAKKAMAGAQLVDAAPEGRLFDHKAEARKVADRLNETSQTVRQGGKIPGHFTVHDADAPRPVSWSKGFGTAPLEFTVRQAGEKWTVVPKVAAERLTKHQAVGTSPNTFAKILRRSGDAFGQAVLPLSLKWMAGQVAEPAIRSAVAGAGPMDFVRTRKVVRRMNADKPGSGDELLQRLSSDRMADLGLGDNSREATRGKSLAHEFEDANPLVRTPAAAATMAGNTVPARAVRTAWTAYTDKVIGSVNAVIESTTRQAMAGQALKNSSHMERRINGLSGKAIDDAAKGLKGTEAQVELARTINRMYGKYQGFSPDRRSFIMHWARFLPWFINAATFLTRTLPVDHPIQTALIADITAANEEWRKEQGLSYRYGGEGSLPDFLLGSYPSGDGGFYRLAGYTPMGLGPDPGASAASLVLPQFQGAARNMAGLDWKGSKLRGRDGEDFDQAERALRAAFSLGESHLVGFGKAGRVSGLTERYVDQEDDEDIPPLAVRLKRELPTTPTKSNAASAGSSGPSLSPIKVKPIRVKPVKVKPIKVR